MDIYVQIDLDGDWTVYEARYTSYSGEIDRNGENQIAWGRADTFEDAVREAEFAARTHKAGREANRRAKELTDGRSSLHT